MTITAPQGVVMNLERKCNVVCALGLLSQTVWDLNLVPTNTRKVLTELILFPSPSSGMVKIRDDVRNHLAVVCPQPLVLGWQVLDKCERFGLFGMQTAANALLDGSGRASARSAVWLLD